MHCCEETAEVVAAHRFLGCYRRRVMGENYLIYRCVCGYTEAAPVNGGPSIALDSRFEPIRDARRIAAHLRLDRAHEMN
jgi:hypothetical protein